MHITSIPMCKRASMDRVEKDEGRELTVQKGLVLATTMPTL